jgi:hypothetical protein
VNARGREIERARQQAIGPDDEVIPRLPRVFPRATEKTLAPSPRDEVDLQDIAQGNGIEHGLDIVKTVGPLSRDEKPYVNLGVRI